MRTLVAILLFVSIPSVQVCGGWTDENLILRRGDANHSGVVDPADAAFLAGWLFSGGPEPPCMNEADANGDGAVNLSDTVYLSIWLFQGGPAPPSPGPFATECSFTETAISCAAGCTSISR